MCSGRVIYADIVPFCHGQLLHRLACWLFKRSCMQVHLCCAHTNVMWLSHETSRLLLLDRAWQLCKAPKLSLERELRTAQSSFESLGPIMLLDLDSFV